MRSCEQIQLYPVVHIKGITALKKITKHTVQSTLRRMRATAMCPLEMRLKRQFLNKRQDGKVQKWTDVTKGVCVCVGGFV